MTVQHTYIPRAVVMYVFLTPNQRCVQFSYPSLQHAKRFFSLALLRQAASAPLQPWVRSLQWELHPPNNEYQKIHRVEPMVRPVLRYQGGDAVLLDALATPAASPIARRRKHVVLKPSEKSVSRRLREQQHFQEEPRARAKTRVHRTYWEDAWSTRRDERSWKRHRKTQWRHPG